MLEIKIDNKKIVVPIYYDKVDQINQRQDFGKNKQLVVISSFYFLDEIEKRDDSFKYNYDYSVKYLESGITNLINRLFDNESNQIVIYQELGHDFNKNSTFIISDLQISTASYVDLHSVEKIIIKGQLCYLKTITERFCRDCKRQLDQSENELCKRCVLIIKQIKPPVID